MEGRRVLLVHHGGHRGGYGVCWDLRTGKEDSGYGKTVQMREMGFLPVADFVEFIPDIVESLRKAGYEDPVKRLKDHNWIRKHFDLKEDALAFAAKNNLVTVTPQVFSKELRKSAEAAKVTPNQPSV